MAITPGDFAQYLSTLQPYDGRPQYQPQVSISLSLSFSSYHADGLRHLLSVATQGLACSRGQARLRYLSFSGWGELGRLLC
jgi:hypothetical protein